jgi:uncharacterized membrane protein
MAIALGLKRDPLVTISAIAVGALGYSLGGTWGDVGGNPIGAYLAAIVGIQAGSLVSKRTPVDIIITPLVTVVVGGLFAKYCCVPVGEWVMSLGEVINRATTLNPFIMGIILSVSVGCILTLPISSAALCAMLGLAGLAGGAATAGCCAQMVGFAVISFRENRVGGLIAQGLGTSMLQMGNIVKKPQIWIPPTLAAAVVGPIATCLFKLECTGVSAGMGTCGLVGPIGVLSDMGATLTSIFGIILLCFVLPALLSLGISELLRRLGWIKDGDMKLEL